MRSGGRWGGRLRAVARAVETPLYPLAQSSALARPRQGGGLWFWASEYLKNFKGCGGPVRSKQGLSFGHIRVRSFLGLLRINGGYWRLRLMTVSRLLTISPYNLVVP